MSRTASVEPVEDPEWAQAGVQAWVMLPAAVRARVIQFAADRLGTLPPNAVPSSLKSIRSFTPAKRARLAAGPLAAALESDAVFRQQVAEGVRNSLPELCAALAAGTAPSAAAPVDVAAAAYLVRPTGWQDFVAAVAEELDQRDRMRARSEQDETVTRLGEQLEGVRAAAREEAARLTAELAAARADNTAVRRAARTQEERTARAETAARTAEEELAAVREAAAQEAQHAAVELRKAVQRQDEAESALGVVRTAAREGRSADQLRLRVLLDALLGAATGLRRELALAPAERRPADAIAGDYALTEVAPGSRQGRSDDDPVLLDALLGVPMVHLLVDGYNVTKGGYGTLTLQEQRGRLLAGLGGLQARTGAEVTVVFDGQDGATSLAVPAPRGVRLLFSRTGETADEVLRRMVRAEPQGRPLVVVSSDREVADGVRASGARPVPSVALLALLARAR